jgi:hypothetical protein
MWAKLEMYRLLALWIVETKIVGHDKLENSKTTEPPSVFLVPLENPQLVGVCTNIISECLDVQCKSYWIFNVFIIENSITTNNQILMEIWAALLLCMKSSW